MKKVLFFGLMIFTVFAFGQKVKSKKNVVYVDGKEYLNVKEDFASNYSYTITSLDNKDLFYLKYNRYLDTKEVDRYNTDGAVSYFEVISPDLNTIYFETDIAGCLMGCKAYDNFVKILYNGAIVNQNGDVDFAKLENLSKKLGFKYAQKREEMSQSSPGNTVIIQQDTRPRNGVNISIGR